MESKMSDPISQPLRPAEPIRPLSSPPKKSFAWLWLWILVLLVIVVVAGILFFRHRGQSSSSADAETSTPSTHGGRGGSGTGPTMVSTTTAQKGDIGIYVNGLGAVTSLNTVSVNSRVEGQIMKVNFQEGQMVKAGEPLIEIDPGPNQASLLQAQGQLERDSATLQNAKLDLERYQEAFASNAIPKQQLDTQVATVQQDDGTVKLDQGQLDNAKLQLAYCYINAPISGRVGLRLVDSGNIVQAGSTNLVVITQLEPISVIFSLAQNFLPEIQKQLRAGNTLTVDAFDTADQNKLATGTLATLDNQISPDTGTFKIRAIFTNEDDTLFPNQFVNAHLLVNTLRDVTLLPNTAIQRNADSAFVYLIAPDKTGTNQTVSMQTITVGTTDGNVSQVDGIDPGTVIVADNFNKLIDGMKVLVRPPSTDSTNSVSSSTNGVAGVHKHRKKTSE
jgi:membrane fusion protein, multidrug efflux system